MQTLTPGPLIGVGRTAEIYAWQDHQILKLFYAEFPPGIAQYEAEKSQLINHMNLPTPRFLGTVEIDGRMGLIYERVEGISMLKMTTQRPWSLVSLARQLAELHTLIHQQDGTGLPSMRPALEATIQRVASLSPGVSGEVLQVLRELPDGQALCHFDFHPDQVMLTEQGTVILDWMTAHQGHPLADVARTTILFKVGQVPYGSRLMQAFINLWRKRFLEAYLARYFALHPALRRDDLTPWLIPVAAGRLDEKIAGEEGALLGIIETALAAL